MLHRPNEGPADDMVIEKRTWRQKWDESTTFDKFLLGFVALLIVLAIVGLFTFLFPTGKATTAPAARNALVGGTEADLGKTVKRVFDDTVDPKIKKVEGAQDALGKRVTVLETPVPPFNYELFYEYAVGKKK